MSGIAQNYRDGSWYGTRANRLAHSELLIADFNVFEEVDTKRAYISYDGEWYPTKGSLDYAYPIPNGGEVLTVNAAGIVEIDVPEGTSFIEITNPVDMRIAYGVDASNTVGTLIPAGVGTTIPSPEACETVSVYFTGSCTGAYSQAWR